MFFVQALRYRVIQFALVASIAFGSGIYYESHRPVPVRTVTVNVPHNVTVEVPVPVITTKVIKQLVQVEDKAEVGRLLAENEKLGVQVTDLMQTVAQLEAKGSGPVTVTPAPTPEETIHVDFKDFRLHFTTDTKTAFYTLTQKFKIETTLGKNDKGGTVALSSLYEVTPGKLVPLTTTEVVLIHAAPSAQKWRFAPTVQAGFALERSTVGSTINKGGVVGVQWLKRGSSAAAEDSTYSLLTPAVFLTRSAVQPALLPFSVNLGQVPHNPLADTWLSLYIGTNGFSKTAKTLGLAVTASF